jgi:hypothetical protein
MAMVNAAAAAHPTNSLGITVSVVVLKANRQVAGKWSLS